MDFVNRSRKAIVAGFGAAGSAVTIGVADGRIDTKDIELIVGAFIVVGVITWFVPNKQP